MREAGLQASADVRGQDVPKDSPAVDKVWPYLILGRAGNVHNQVALHTAFLPDKTTSLVLPRLGELWHCLLNSPQPEHNADFKGVHC